jgi:hypothetical protein
MTYADIGEITGKTIATVSKYVKKVYPEKIKPGKRIIKLTDEEIKKIIHAINIGGTFKKSSVPIERIRDVYKKLLASEEGIKLSDCVKLLGVKSDNGVYSAFENNEYQDHLMLIWSESKTGTTTTIHAMDRPYWHKRRIS